MSDTSGAAQWSLSSVREQHLGVAVLALTAVALLLSGWLDDDAFITLRTIDNLLEGRGPVWNPAERVQAYTHPLWLGLNAVLISITGEFELTCVVTAIVLSLGTVYLLVFRVARSIRFGCCLVLGLLLSKSFVDYSTSGLEDPLTRLLLVVFALTFAGRDSSGSSPARLGLTTLIASLATLCRPDAILLFVPALLVELRRHGSRQSLRVVVLGFAPIVAWGLFALFYYGSPFPNTAFAKLGAGVPQAGLLVQGAWYLVDSLLRDTVTLVLTAIGIACTVRRGDTTAKTLAAGAVLYLLYVVWIGGGYMSGRFLGLPLLASVLGMSNIGLPRPNKERLLTLMIVGSVLLVPRLLEPTIQSEVGMFGIGDERRTHHPYTGLLYAALPGRWPEHSLRAMGEELVPGSVTASGAIGMMGFYGGPDVHLVDIFALSDPLLARLPGEVRFTYNRPHRLGWRPGHVRRPIPKGYLQSLPGKGNQIADRDLAAYYDVVRLVTRGPLFSRERLRAVIGLNIGEYDHLVSAYVEKRLAVFDPSAVPRELAIDLIDSSPVSTGTESTPRRGSNRWRWRHARSATLRPRTSGLDMPVDWMPTYRGAVDGHDLIAGQDPAPRSPPMADRRG